MRISVFWVSDLPDQVPMAWHIDAEQHTVTFYLNRDHPETATSIEQWGTETIRALEERGGAYAILGIAPPSAA